MILLPPSETKRDGGTGGPLDLGALSFPRLTSARRTAIRALRALSRNRANSLAALRLGPKLTGEVDRNRALTTSATMPAIDRYSGVLYDALDASSLDSAARSRAGRSVAIASALFGLSGALDPVPAYRLSHDSRLPELSLRRLWAGPIGVEFASSTGMLLDLRSEGYVALGPVPRGSHSYFLRVVSDDGGEVRALNHFNKAAKGLLVRELLTSAVELSDVDDLIGFAGERGINLRLGRPGELWLIAAP